VRNQAVPGTEEYETWAGWPRPRIEEMKYQGLVSVIIPCFKQAHFLGEAIESVQAQTYTCHEIVVIDDGSPDNTEEVARRYPTVRYLRQENRGLPSARNTGIRASHGNYLVFLDADDRLLPSHFEENLNGFESKPDAAIVCGDYRLFGADEIWHIHGCDPTPDHYGTLLRTNFIGPPHPAMFRRDVVLEVGMFREELRSCEDLDLYLRIARGRMIYCHHQLIAEYRRHGGQMSKKWGLMLAQGMKVLWKQWEHVQGNLAYEQAFRAGIKRMRHAYGEPLLWQMVAEARSGDVVAAGRACWTLLQYYPESLRWLVRQKLERAMGKVLAGR
jgi:glycosyltransferase involved in cell wall biosynthesis